jgi:hypothetical protein
MKYFEGKRVKIFVHLDENKAGERGAAKWIYRLHELGACEKLQVYTFDYGARQTNVKLVADLNDLLRVDYDSWEQHREKIESVMEF